MKLVVQEDSMGCGVACTASVLGISYAEALRLFSNGRKKAQTEGFYSPNIVKALKLHGYAYRHRKAHSNEEDFSKKTIVFIERSSMYPFGHYLAKANKGWMDPWVNFPMFPRIAGFRDKLPGAPQYVVFQAEAK